MDFELIDPDQDGYILRTQTTDGRPAQAFVTTLQLIGLAVRRGAYAADHPTPRKEV